MLACCALLAGCGGGSDEDDIKAVGTDLVSAVKDKDWQGVCDKFSAKAQQQLEKAGAALGSKDCPGIMKQLFSDAKESDFKNADKITDVKVNGNTATGKAGDDETRFVKEDGEWKVDVDPAGS